MTLDEAQQRIVARMTPTERTTWENGCQIVDWLMSVASDDALPASTRSDARDKLRACAMRQPSETVQDVIGPKH